MEHLALIVGLGLVTIMMVSLGDRLKLPYPVLMVLASIGIAFIPGFPYLEIPAELILPLFLPPLLYATAMKTSWSVFRVRWRSVVLLAVALVVLTVAVVTGAMWLLVPSMGIPAAIALGAMVSPPDPVAVESVAGKVNMPRRLITVLQSEGLFNDAAAIVIFQAAVAAAVKGEDLTYSVVEKFIVGAVIAVILGLFLGWFTKLVVRFTDSSTARSAITLVMPFAVYLLAETVHASGVIAVVVLALEIRRNSRPQDAEERITSRSFWEVLELILTGIAFGLVGLEIRHIIEIEGNEIPGMLGIAGVVCVLVFAVRFLWLSALIYPNLKHGGDIPPTGFKDVTVLTWSGMRGLATIALALSLPTTLADGSPFPNRDIIIVVAAAVLVSTLVIPGLTLPLLMKVLKLKQDAGSEREEVMVLAASGREAAIAAVNNALAENPDLSKSLTAAEVDEVKATLFPLERDLTHDRDETWDAHEKDKGETIATLRTIALLGAREEVLRLSHEPGVDPEIAHKVLHRLDMLTLLEPNGHDEKH